MIYIWSIFSKCCYKLIHHTNRFYMADPSTPTHTYTYRYLRTYRFIHSFVLIMGTKVFNLSIYLIIYLLHVAIYLSIYLQVSTYKSIYLVIMSLRIYITKPKSDSIMLFIHFLYLHISFSLICIRSKTRIVSIFSWISIYLLTVHLSTHSWWWNRTDCLSEKRTHISDFYIKTLRAILALNRKQ